MLEMQQQIVKQLAMSRNHQNAGDEKVPYMSIKYTMDEGSSSLTEDQIDGLMGKYTYRSWFNINGADIQPMEWTKRVPLTCKDAFKEVSVSMIVFDKRELEFDGCRLYIDKFKLLSGGTVLADFRLHVLKAKNSEWNCVGEAEYSEVKLSLGDGVLIERKARKQRQLPFEADPNADNDGDGHPDPDATNVQPPLTGAHLSGEPRDETLIWWQHGTTEEQFAGKRCDMPKDCVEIDPPKGCKSEIEQLAKLEGSGSDLADFAEGAARAVGARKKRGSNVIDGRSERVKHQDRLKGRDDAH